jgi:hypothetical protein
MTLGVDTLTRWQWAGNYSARMLTQALCAAQLITAHFDPLGNCI